MIFTNPKLSDYNKASSYDSWDVDGRQNVYLTFGVKHCFKEIYCVGCQRTLGPVVRVYSYKDYSSFTRRRGFHSYYDLRTFSITFGILLRRI